MRDGRARSGDLGFDLFRDDPFQVAVERTEKGVRVRGPAAPEPARGDAKAPRGPNGPMFKRE